jgi:hypothetical protein
MESGPGFEKSSTYKFKLGFLKLFKIVRKVQVSNFWCQQIVRKVQVSP